MTPRPERARPRHEPPARWTLPRLLAIPAFVALCTLVARDHGFSVTVPVAYLGMSAVAFAAYGFDKAAARARQWRTPESTLHLMSLACGWPGALLAQQLLRHKTSKHRFLAVFWLTVFANVAVFLAWQGALPLPHLG